MEYTNFIKQNLRGVFGKIEKSNLDAVALTETKKKDQGSEEKNGYIHIYSGFPKEEIASSEVSLSKNTN